VAADQTPCVTQQRFAILQKESEQAVSGELGH